MMSFTFTSLDEQCVLDKFVTLDQTNEGARLEKGENSCRRI